MRVFVVPVRRLVRAALLVALLVVVTGHAVTRVFVLNFSTAGPNATALLALALVTGVVVPVVGRSYSRRRDRTLVGVAAAGVGLSLHPTPVVSLVGATAAATCLTPPLTADVTRLRGRAGGAVGLGLLVVVTGRALTGATAPHATTLGRAGVVVLTLAVVAVARRDASASDVAERTSWVAPLGGVVLLAAAWLGAPVASARWAGLAYQPALALSTVGLVAGTWAAVRDAAEAPGRVVVAGVTLLAGMGGVLAGRSTAVAGIVLATAALPLLGGAGGLGRVPPRRAALATAGVQSGCLLALFGFVFAVNAAFVPAGALLRGTAPAFVLGLAGLVGSAAVVVATLAHRSGSDTEVPAPLVPDPARRTTLTGVAIGLVAPLGARVRAPDPSVGPSGPLRIGTYNIHRYVDAAGRYSLGAVADLLRDQRVGIVGLQETTGTRLTTGHTYGVRWLASRLGYHYAVAPSTSAEGYGVALLSAWPIGDTRIVALPRTDGAPRVALRAVVDHPDGALPVVVTHLETAGPVRTRQATRVRRLVADADRAVVLGDFNATPNEVPIDVMTAAFTDAWATAGAGEGATFGAATPTRRIDYVFVRGLRVETATVFGTSDDSDHRGVRATVAFG